MRSASTSSRLVGAPSSVGACLMMRQRQPLQIIARQGGRKHVALAWRGGADRASAAAAGRMAPARHVAHGAAAQLCAQLVLRLAPFNTITAASPSSAPSSPYSLMEPPLHSPPASSSPRDVVFSFGAQMAAASSASRGSRPVRSSSSEHDSASAGASAAALDPACIYQMLQRRPSVL